MSRSSIINIGRMRLGYFVPTVKDSYRSHALHFYSTVILRFIESEKMYHYRFTVFLKTDILGMNHGVYNYFSDGRVHQTD